MGYYTAYSLTVKGDEERVAQFEKELVARSEEDAAVQDLVEMGAVYAKLYYIEDWISDIAPNYPDLLVILNGDGEESDDLWEERWRGNDFERKEAVIPPFTNPNLLTEYEKSKLNS